MPALCTEIVDAILSYLSDDPQNEIDRATLRSCLLVSRLFHHEALRHLLVHVPICLDNPGEGSVLSHLCTQLERNGGLPKRIKSFAFTLSSMPKSRICHSVSTDEAISHLTNLLSLSGVFASISHISFINKSRHLTTILPQDTQALAALVKALELRLQCPSVTHIAVRNMFLHPVFVFGDNSLQSLSHLSFDDASLWQTSRITPQATLLAQYVRSFGGAQLQAAFSHAQEKRPSFAIAKELKEVEVSGFSNLFLSFPFTLQGKFTHVQLPPTLRRLSFSTTDPRRSRKIEWTVRPHAPLLTELQVHISDGPDLQCLDFAALPALERLSLLMQREPSESSNATARGVLSQTLFDIFSTASPNNTISEVSIIWNWTVADSYGHQNRLLDVVSYRPLLDDLLGDADKFPHLKSFQLVFAVYGFDSWKANDRFEVQQLAGCLFPKTLHRSGVGCVVEVRSLVES